MAENGDLNPAEDAPDADVPYYTARHLLNALQRLDEQFLDLPLVLIHGKELHKPNLVQGLIPAPTPVSRRAVETKPPSLLTLGELVDDGPFANGLVANGPPAESA
jgi:hypothetical protein